MSVCHYYPSYTVMKNSGIKMWMYKGIKWMNRFGTNLSFIWKAIYKLNEICQTLGGYFTCLFVGLLWFC